MSEMSLKDGLQAGEVADYLREHPQFLKQFPDLAMALEMPREQGPAASLASYQLDVLRGKNRELNRKLSELIAVAGDNEQLMVQVHSLTTSLLRATSAADVARMLVAGLTEDFHTDLVRLLLFRPAADLPVMDWLATEPTGAAALPELAQFLERSEPLIGRLAPEKLQRLFGDKADQVQSAALVRLGEVGLVAIGSTDANRFHPGMGGIFLKLIGEAVTVAFERYPAAG